MRDAWRVVVLDLPDFGPAHVWLTVSRREPGDVVERYRRSATPDGVIVTAGGGVPSARVQLPAGGLRRRDAQLVCEALGVQLRAEGLHVLSDARRMARMRRLGDQALRVAERMPGEGLEPPRPLRDSRV